MSTPKIYAMAPRRGAELFGFGLLFLVTGILNVAFHVQHFQNGSQPHASRSGAARAITPEASAARDRHLWLTTVGGVLSGLIFVPIGLNLWRRSLTADRASVAIDGEGLWPLHLPREEALLRWQEIAATRERIRLNRVDLLDEKGNLRLKLDYELEDLFELRRKVAHRMKAVNHLQHLPVTFSNPWTRSLGMVLVIAVCLALSYSFLPWDGSTPLMSVIFGGMALLAGYQLATAPTGLRLTRNTLELNYPFQTKTFPREEVDYVNVEIAGSKQIRACRLVIGLKDKNPARLLPSSLPPTEMQQLLEVWLQMPTTGPVIT